MGATNVKDVSKLAEREVTGVEESKAFLTEQLITYIGNKRSLIEHIEQEIREIHKEMGVSKTVNCDLFSGSGVVARAMKRYSSILIANDLEKYSEIINRCYLSNRKDFDEGRFKFYQEKINKKLDRAEYVEGGLITSEYAPQDDKDIKKDERTFYTTDNAKRIDTVREEIENIPEDIRDYFLAPLLHEASVKTNTSGVFKGFYKDSKTGIGMFGGKGQNALSRIMGKIEVKSPVLSEFDCESIVYSEDANDLVSDLKDLDIVYIDPPYNQHPYGSNYFMLNTIIDGRKDVEVSKVSGIPKDWNRSAYNKRNSALRSLEHVVKTVDAKYAIISYNSEGFITFDEMKGMLEKYGDVYVKEIKYNTFRGSRNLSGRSLYVKEFIFRLRKG